DRVRVDAVGEDAAVSIEDVAALGRRRDRAQLLALGARHQIVVPHDLQEDETRLDPRRPGKEDRGGGDEPALEGMAPTLRRAQGGGGLRRHAVRYLRATTDFGGAGVGRTRSITVASSGPGETMCSRSVASRSM